VPVIAAPQACRMVWKIHGKEAHAGVSPESGINAIKVAADAISSIKMGRIDFETTANIGIISGGTATNIIPKTVEVHGEARSHNPAKLERQVKHMSDAFKKAVKKARRPGKEFAGLPRLNEIVYPDYPKMRLTEKNFTVGLYKAAAESLGRKVALTVGGGGSDANIFNHKGIECLIIGSGMERVHSTSERCNLNNLCLGAEMLARAIELYPKLLKK
jgi:tripeptide aminopeptidase